MKIRYRNVRTGRVVELDDRDPRVPQLDSTTRWARVEPEPVEPDPGPVEPDPGPVEPEPETKPARSRRGGAAKGREAAQSDDW